MNMNEVTLIGRSSAAAEIRYTQNQMPVINISLATTEKYKDGGEKTSWHKVVLFGKIAERFGPLIMKGTELLVFGKLNYNEWTDKTGNKHKSCDIIAHIVKITQQPKGFQPDQQAQSSSQASTPDFMGGSMNEEMDIPF